MFPTPLEYTFSVPIDPENKVEYVVKTSPNSMPTSSVNNNPVSHQVSTRYALLGVALLIIIVVLGAYKFYQYNNKEPVIAEEPVPTVESFRKNYVVGCELKPTTFSFTDGASLTGEFAECPEERDVTFFATTTVLEIPSKNSLTVHHIMAREKESTYPIVSVYFPYDINAQSALQAGAQKIQAAGTSTRATGPIVSAESVDATATSSEITMADIEKSGTVATFASDGAGITWGMVIQQGYMMVLHSKTSGYLFDQNTLKYSDVLN